MLDRVKLMVQLQNVSDQLFHNFASELTIAQGVWQRIAADPTFIYKVKAASLPWQMPLWEGTLDEAIPVSQINEPYRVFSVDGSQIYPDRHQGTSCYLINVGSVSLAYGKSQPGANFSTIPYVFAHEDKQDISVTPDFVNCRRQEFEFEGGVALTSAAPTDQPSVFLFDGSLIFWHLASKETNLKELFLSKYIDLLEKWHQHKTLIAGYVSLPKNKELVNLIRASLCDFDDNTSDAHTLVTHLVDTTIAGFFLSPNTRSIVFKNQSSICFEYPEHLHPHFFYLDNGIEIGRVEIPAWIARDEQAVDRVAQIILDQCIKGRGYPVVIAEAHEQAVVKGPDREFFYQLITKLSYEQKKRISMSQKSLKKRGIGI